MASMVGLPLLLAAVLTLRAPGAAEAAPPPGLVFHVGGPRGWRVPDAGTNYGWWAMHNRYRVGDDLYFRYDNDSVLVVGRAAFDACNATNPVAAFADGATTFRLDRPGFFCFISGEPGHCEEGQRLAVRVMVHPAVGAPGQAAQGPAAAAAAPQNPGHGGSAAGGASSGSAVTVAAAAVAAAAVALAIMFQ